MNSYSLGIEPQHSNRLITKRKRICGPRVFRKQATSILSMESLNMLRKIVVCLEATMHLVVSFIQTNKKGTTLERAPASSSWPAYPSRYRGIFFACRPTIIRLRDLGVGAGEFYVFNGFTSLLDKLAHTTQNIRKQSPICHNRLLT